MKSPKLWFVVFGLYLALGPARAQLLETDFGPVILGATDDGSTAAISPPFAIPVYGRTYTQFWINNNGNVTFDAALHTYTSFAFPNAQGNVIIAPFFADVDTQPAASGHVHYRATADKVIITWDHVGYYSGHADKLNTFQLVLTADGLAEFGYDDMQWTTGDYSGGSGGFGGTPARAGFDSGDGAHAIVFWQGNDATSLSFLAHKQFFYDLRTGAPTHIEPPVANAGPDQTVEQQTLSGTSVLLDGSGSQYTGSFSDLTFTWSEGATALGTGVTLQHVFPRGVHNVTLTVSNGRLSSTDSLVVTVQDTIPPETSIIAGPTEGSVACAPVTFRWTGVDTGTDTPNLRYLYRTDGGEWQGPGSADNATLSGLVNGPHVFEVAAMDESGNTDLTPAVRHFNIDLAPPTLASSPTAAVTPVSATVQWKTSEPATSQVEYGPTPSFGFLTTVDTSLVVDHSGTLSDLVPNLAYHYRVRSADRCGNEMVSDDGTFTTAPGLYNPSFEMPSAGPSWVTYTAGQTFGGWTVEYGSVDLSGPIWQAADGTQSVDLSGNGSGGIYQDVSTPAAQMAVRFALSGNMDCPAPSVKTLDVRVGDSLLGSPSWNGAGHSDSNMGWEYHVLYFAPSQPISRLRFLSTTDSCGGPMIDDVSLVPVTSTTPETSITTGIAEGSLTCDSSTVICFDGSDAVSPKAALRYQYRLDGGAWSAAATSTCATLTALPSGSHTFEVAAVNEAGNVDPTPAVRHFSVDSLAPVITNAAVPQSSETAATVTWATNKPSTSLIRYRVAGTTAWQLTTEDTNLVTAHSVGLSGLTPDTPYEVQAISHDGCAREAISALISFRTLPDVTPPSTGIQSGPNEGDTICADSVQYCFSGSDNVTPVASLRYRYQVDGGAWQGPVSTSCVTLTGLADGPHPIHAEAIDAAGNIDPVGVTRHFTVDVLDPKILGLPEVTPSALSAQVSWTTDKAATSQLRYREAAGTDWTTTTEDPALSTAHQVTLSGLHSETAYVVDAVSRDSCGHQVTSADVPFRTGAAPNLVVVNATAPSPVKAGTAFNVSWTDRNVGSVAAATAWIDRVYLSTDGHYNPQTDTLAEVGYRDGLDPGKDLARNAVVTIPVAKAAGTYVLTVVTDALNAVPESTYADNAQTLNVNVVAFDFPPTTTILDSQHGSSVDDSGTACTLPVTVQWTGSDDTTPVAQLRYQWLIDAGAWSDSTPDTQHVFTTLSEGNHIFRVRSVDSAGQTDPNAPVLHFTVAATPPVVANLQSAPTAAGATISWTTDIPTTAHVEYGTTHGFGSDVPVDTTPTILHVATLSGLSAQTVYYFRTHSVSACSKEALGDGSFQTLPPADLTIAPLSAPTSAGTLENLTVSWTVTNGGPGVADGNWFDCVYLSADGQLANATKLACSQRPHGLSVGGQYAQSATFQLPSVSAGDYQFILNTNDGHDITESNFANNTASAGTVHVHVTVAPKIAPIPDATSPEAVPYVGPTPSLVQGSLPLNWTLVAGPSGTVVNPNTGVVRWGQTIGSPTPYTITIQGANAAGSDQATWHLSVPVSYAATVAATPKQAPAGTPIHLRGHTVSLADGTPVPNVPVSIRLHVRGTRRVLSTSQDSSAPTYSDAAGNFDVLFSPLPNEAGIYTVGAAHPSDVNDPSQDSFTIYGMDTLPDSAAHDIIPGIPVDGSTTLRNLGDVALSGITAQTDTPPAGLQVVVNPPNALAPSASSSLTYTLKYTGNTTLDGTLPVHLTSAEGATATFSLNLHIRPPRPALSVLPTSLGATALRGEQTLVEFEVTNSGGAVSDAITVAPPASTWISLVTPSTIGPLAPGESARVTVALTPGPDVDLVHHTGQLVVGPGLNYGVAVPFDFLVKSNQLGQAAVTVTDEATFWSTGQHTDSGPLVPGAIVQLVNPDDNTVVREYVTTDTTTPAPFTDVPEGYYVLQVQAPNHGRYRQTVEIRADQFNVLSTFVPIESVRYTWTVQPTTIPDVTVTTLQATFSTDVPVPVVTVDPPLVDLATLTDRVTQINFTVENHGLIAAKGVRLDFPSYSNWKITVLSDDLGDLGAHEKRIVPVLIERVPTGGPDGGGGQDISPCTFTACVDWQLFCVTLMHYCVSVNFTNANGNCGPLPGPGGGTGGSGGGFTAGDDRGGPGSPFVNQPTFSPPSICACDPNKPTIVDLGCHDLTLEFNIAAAAFEAYLFAQTDGAIANFFKPLAFQDVTACASVCCTKSGSVDFSADAHAHLKSFDPPEGGPAPGFEFPFPITKTLSVVHGGQITLVDVSVTGKVQVKIPPHELKDLRPDIDLDATYRKDCGAPGCLKATGTLTWNADVGIDSGIDVTVRDHTTFAPLDSANFGITGLLHLGAKLGYTYDGCGKSEGIACFEGIYAQAQVGGQVKFSDGTTATVGLPCSRYYIVCPRGTCGEAGTCTILNPCAAERKGLSDLSDPSAAFSDLERSLNRIGSIEHPARTSPIGSDHLYRYTLEPMIPLLPASAWSPWAASPKRNSRQDSASEGICAKVRLQLEQQVVLTRAAFNGALQIDNASDGNVSSVFVNLDIRDAAGNPANDKFAIYPPTLHGLTGVDGTGVVGPQSSGSANWIIVPRREAAPTQTTHYTIGGLLSFYQDGFGQVAAPLQAAPIDVTPDPRLGVDYFWQRDVYADDPFTPEIEPSEPFSLGFLMKNSGYGTARNVQVVSSQPQIIENTRGLLIDFKIIGTQVGSQPVSPSLTVGLGDIGPGQNAVARWLMTSSLQGTFSDYSATFKHINPLNDPTLSLIDTVNIHELEHVVRIDVPSDDSVPDFLAKDVPDPDNTPDALAHLPDTVYSSDGTKAAVTPRVDATVDGQVSGTNLVIHLSLPSPPTGWVFIRRDDPGAGIYRLASVERSDGRQVRLDDNAWETHRTIRTKGQEPYKQNRLYIFDSNSTGSYTLTYSLTGPPPPVLTTIVPSAAKAGAPGFTLVANGASFDTTSAIVWNGTPLTTTYVSSVQLTANVPAAFIGAPGTADVAVVTPNGNSSNPLGFQITSSQPTLSFAAPGSAPGTVQVNGVINGALPGGALTAATLSLHSDPSVLDSIHQDDITPAAGWTLNSVTSAPGATIATLAFDNATGQTSTGPLATIRLRPAVGGKRLTASTLTLGPDATVTDHNNQTYLTSDATTVLPGRTRSLGGTIQGAVSTGIVNGAKVIAVEAGGVLHLLNASDLADVAGFAPITLNASVNARPMFGILNNLPVVAVGTSDGRLLVFNATNGVPMDVGAANPLGTAINTAPAIDYYTGDLYVAVNGYAGGAGPALVQISHGAMAAFPLLGTTVASSPAFMRGSVVVGTDTAIQTFRQQGLPGLTPQSAFPVDSITNSPVLNQAGLGLMAAKGVSNAANVYQLNAINGNSSPTVLPLDPGSSPLSEGFGSPMITYGSHSGTLYRIGFGADGPVIDLAHTLPSFLGPISPQPIVISGVSYAVDDQGNFRSTDGAQFNIGGQPTMSVAATGPVSGTDSLVVATKDGTVEVLPF